jgi:hypothetical protein
MASSAEAPPRPETISSAKLGPVQSREPWELQERLGRNRIIEKIMNEFSGFGGNTTADQRNYYSMVKVMCGEGFECDIEVELLEEIMKLSGDEQGKNKTQLIQVVEEKPVLLPGAAGLYPPVEPTPGWLTRGWNLLTGKGSGGGSS